MPRYTSQPLKGMTENRRSISFRAARTRFRLNRAFAVTLACAQQLTQILAATTAKQPPFSRGGQSNQRQAGRRDQ